MLTAGAGAGDSRADLQSAQHGGVSQHQHPSGRCSPLRLWAILSKMLSIAVLHSLLQPVVSQPVGVATVIPVSSSVVTSRSNAH